MLTVFFWDDIEGYLVDEEVFKALTTQPMEALGDEEFGHDDLTGYVGNVETVRLFDGRTYHILSHLIAPIAYGEYEIGD